MLKSRILISATLSVVLLLAGCSALPADNDTPVENQPPAVSSPDVTPVPSETTSTPTTSAPATDFSEPEVLDHVELAPYASKDGEAKGNVVYYKATDNDVHGHVYEVIRADDGEKVALPRTETVLYESDSDDHYYEEVKYTYKIGEETVETTQFSLHVPVADAGDESSDADTDVGTDANAGQDENKADSEEAAPGPDNAMATSAAAPTEKAGN